MSQLDPVAAGPVEFPSNSCPSVVRRKLNDSNALSNTITEGSAAPSLLPSSALASSGAADTADNFQLPFGIEQVKTNIRFGLVASFLMGYTLSIMNGALPLLSWGLSWCPGELQKGDPWICTKAKSQSACVNGIVIIGAAFGSCLCSHLNQYGMLTSLKVINLTFALGAGVCALSSRFGNLLVGRLVSGLAVGAATVAPTVYASGLSVLQERSHYSALHQLWIVIGILIGVCATFPLMEVLDLAHAKALTQPRNSDWFWCRLSMGLPVVFGAAAAARFHFGPQVETPERLCAAGRQRLAEELLLLIYEESFAFTDTPVPLRTNAPSSSSNYSAPSHDQALQAARQEFTRIEQSTRLVTHGAPSTAPVAFGFSGRSRDLLRYLQQLAPTRAHAKALWVVTVLAILQQLVGINVFTTMSNALFEAVGVTPGGSIAASAVMALANVGATVYATKRIGNKPRKQVFIVGSLLLAAILFSAVVLSSLLRPPLDSTFCQIIFILLVCAYMIVYSASLGPGLFIYLNEALPEDTKVPVLSVAFGLNWIASFASIYFASILTQTQTFILFGCMATVFALFCKSFVLESLHNPSPYVPKSIGFMPTAEVELEILEAP